MQHAFNIYPALLILTPVGREQTLLHSTAQESEWATEADRYFTSCPQTYWGNCISNEKYTQLMFGYRNEAETCPVYELTGERVNVLEPAKFKGKQYTITYIPVLN